MEHSNDFKTDVRVCTETYCKDEDEELWIKCTKCKRSFDFACKKFPIYQLSFFLSRFCLRQLCVKIPAEFQKKFNNHEKSIYETLKGEVNACENINKVKKENESKLINGIKKIEQETQKGKPWKRSRWID